MKMNLICVGKIKESYLTAAIKEYSKRLTAYTKMAIIELPDEKTPDNASPADELIIKQKEGNRILNKINEKDYMIALDIKGEQLSSENFAAFIDSSMTRGISTLSFVIGGSLGLDDAVTKRANHKLSFSNMTFPHQLMRVILLEQIYRGFRIIRGEPYHK